VRRLANADHYIYGQLDLIFDDINNFYSLITQVRKHRCVISKNLGYVHFIPFNNIPQDFIERDKTIPIQKFGNKKFLKL
jgi:hypothetical protein